MKETKNYFIHKDEEDKEITYIEFSKKQDYVIKPKVKINDIKIDKIVISSPDLGEKVARKKVEIAYRKIFDEYKYIDDTDESDGTNNAIKETIEAAERLKYALMNKYIKQLGPEFRGLTLQKLEILINELKTKLFIRFQRKETKTYFPEEETEKKSGRGR